MKRTSLGSECRGSSSEWKGQSSECRGLSGKAIMSFLCPSTPLTRHLSFPSTLSFSLATLPHSSRFMRSGCIVLKNFFFVLRRLRYSLRAGHDLEHRVEHLTGGGELLEDFSHYLSSLALPASASSDHGFSFLFTSFSRWQRRYFLRKRIQNQAVFSHGWSAD